MLNNQKELILKQLNYNEEKRDSLESKYNSLKTEIEKMDNNIEEIQNLKYNTQNSIEKIEGELRLGNEKINMIEKEMLKLDTQVKELKQRIKEISNEREKIENRNEEVSNKLVILRKQLENKNNLFVKISKDINDREKNIEEQKSDVIELFNLIADKKSKINSINIFNQNIEKRIKQINNELEELTKNKNYNDTKLLESINEIEFTKKKLRDVYELKQKKVNEKDINEKEYNKVLEEFNLTKEKIQAKLSKCGLLKDMKNEYEGFYKSVKNALFAINNSKILGKGAHGVVADLITVEKKYEKAIEVALGSSLQNIVTDNEENAKNIINYLKKNKLGRVTFLPMTSIKEKNINSNERKILGSRGCLGIASNIIKYDKQYKRVFGYLLGRVVIVDSIDNGIKVARLCNHSMKIVALDGDVINAGGSITGGSYNNNYTNILGRNRQIEELENEINNYESHEKLLRDKLSQIKGSLSSLVTYLSSLDSKMNEYKILLSNIENKKHLIEDESSKIENMISKYKGEMKQLTQESNDSIDRMKEFKNELYQLNEKSDSTKGSIGSMEKSFEDEKVKRDSIQKEIADIRVEVASCEQELKSIDETIFKLDEEKTRVVNDLKQKLKDYEQDNHDIDRLKNECLSLKEDKKKFSNILLEQEIKLKEIKGAKNDYLQTFYSEQEKLSEMNRKINDLQKSINTLEIKNTKYNTQLENIVNKLWDEYELSYKMALNYRNDDESVTKMQSDVRKIKNQIKSLGNINVGAIEEYERVKERYEFLIEQKKDLIDAKDTLNKVIKDMESKMKEQFIDNFQVIRNNFKEVFIKLFGGGKSDIYLEKEEDALNSGIEIIAQPPGKKLQRLSLLSGGERALTAIALLFAILRTKPTPFCILDEIEAALDDANVYRFAEYLSEFSNETQFIVITHRKGTMESVDALYGVTMEEEGVSKLVSVKLSDKLSEKAS